LPPFRTFPAAFHLAISSNNPKIVEMMIEANGGNINDIIQYDNKTYGILYDPVRRNNIPIVEILLRHGADINKFNLVPHVGSVEMLRFLLEHGADINGATENARGETLLHIVADYPIKNWEELLQFALDSGADINKVTAYGMTPLAVAVSSRNTAAVRFFIEHGADPDLGDDKNNPLYIATFYFAPDNIILNMVRLLLELGANPNKAIVPILNTCIERHQNKNFVIKEFIFSGKLDVTPIGDLFKRYVEMFNFKLDESNMNIVRNKTWKRRSAAVRGFHIWQNPEEFGYNNAEKARRGGGHRTVKRRKATRKSRRGRRM
jgi:ankyrin repeat protein